MNRNELTVWLGQYKSTSLSPLYSHVRFKENLNERDKVFPALKKAVHAAHEDARRHLRELFYDSLDPLVDLNESDISGYPEELDLTTLKGFFGEIVASMIIENFEPFAESGWEVPALMFRFHQAAFDRLEEVRQTGEIARPVLGHFGDDCLGFKRDLHGVITKCVVCEAKCTKNHDSEMLNEAHRNISSSLALPRSLWSLIEILNGYDDQASREWVKALRFLRMSKGRAPYERFDMVCYTCGKSHKQGGIENWIPSDKPDHEYTGGRNLHAVEVHLSGVDNLVETLYKSKDQVNDSRINDS